MTDPTQHDRDTIVAELVGEALERRDETGGVDLAELCSEHPDVIDDVRQALEVASKLPGLQTAGVGGDRAVGSIFADRYRIDERVGAGAMGVVYGATDLDLGRSVAIKVLHLGLLDATEAAARFEREASALAAIEHESVVTIHDRGTTEDGSPFLVMERVDGVSLSHVLDEARSLKDLRDDTGWLKERLGIEGLEEPSFLRQSVRWSASLASGLAAAHRAGVYHRDVKPSNVMIRRDGRAVLLDFGIAAKDDHATLTRSDAAVGTPAYMAPEALAGRTKARPSQDVYGLSATLYHLLTMRAPYQGSPSEVLTALATREPVPAFRVRPGLPRDAQAILDAGLARKATDRYPSADALENDLRAFLAYRPVSVRPVSTMTRGWRKLRRARAFQGAAAVALAVAAFAAYDAYNTRLEDSRGDSFDSAHVQLPANLGFVKAIDRVLRDPALRASVENPLNDAVAAQHEVVGPRTMRALFRFDHGDHAGAADDMQVIAEHLDTALARELARLYAGTTGGAPAILGLDVDTLPEPERPEDSYLAAVHALRHPGGNAGALLPHEGLEHVRHAVELRFLLDVMPLQNLDREERNVKAGRAQRELQQLEERLGSQSAMTAHWEAWLLALQSRYSESIEVAEQGIALAPASHVTLNNLAFDCWRLGRNDEARDYANRLIASHPTYSKAYATLARVAMAAEDYDGARSIMEHAPIEDEPGGETRRQSVLGLIEADRALELQAAGDSDGAQGAARTALGHVGALRRPQPEDVRNRGICKAILAEDDHALLCRLYEWVEADPLWPGAIRNARRFTPATLDDEEAAIVLRAFDQIADALDRRASIGSVLR